MHDKRGPQNREKKQMSSKGLWDIVRNAFKNIKAVPGRSRKGTNRKHACKECEHNESDEQNESKPRGAPRLWSILDHILAACAMFEFKLPSLLQLDNLRGTCQKNLKTLFKIDNVPSDTHMREELDKINPQEFEIGFKEVLNAAQRNGVLASMEFYEGSYLVAMDGTDMFRSEAVHCDNCCSTRHASGRISYHHKLLAGAIVCPGVKTVLPLFPEAILKQDGKTKNDCEQVAAVRFLNRLKRMHPRMHFTITADAIQAVGPQIARIESLGYKFILKVKPGSHKTLIEDVERLFALEEQRVKTTETQDAYKASRESHKGTESKCPVDKDAKTKEEDSIGALSYRENGVLYEIRWVNEVPLNGTSNAPIVNYIECRRSVDDQDPKAMKKAARAEAREKERDERWKKMQADAGEPDAQPTKPRVREKVRITAAVTNWLITKENAKRLVEGLLAEWKIENETFNTLKNQGYKFEHNFGHGYLYLQNVLAVLMMLTFLIDQIVAATCALYQAALDRIGSFKQLWARARTLLMEFVIPDWQTLWAYLASPNKITLKGLRDTS